MSGKVYDLLFKLSASLGPNFNKSFTQAKSATKELQEVINKSNKTVKDIEGYKRTEAALKTNKAAYDEQKAVLKDLIRQQEAAGGSSKALATKIARQQEKIAKTETAIKNNTEALGKYKESLKEAGVNTGNLSAESEKLAKQIEKAADAQRRAANIGALQEENGKKIAATKKELIGTVKVISAVGTGTLVAMQKASDATDRVDKLSQKIGISRKGFQEWDFILSQSGTSIDKMQVGMKTLVQRMQEAAKGKGTGADALKSLGVAAVDTSGKLRSQEDVFEEVAHKMQDMPKGAVKSQLAFDLFGKAGLELMPLLNSTGGSIEDLKKKAEDLGIVLSDEAIDAGVNYQDAMDQLKRSLGGVSTQILATLMPTVIKGAKALSEATGKAQKFAKEHPKLINSIAKLAAGAAAAKVGFLGLKFGFLEVKGAILGVRGAITMLKALQISKGIGGIKALFAGMSGSILLIIAMITAIAVAIKLVMGNVDAIREKIRSVFGDAGVAVFDKFVGFIKNIANIVKNVFSRAAGPIGKFFQSFQAGSPIMESLKKLFEGLGQVLPTIITALANLAQAVLPILIQVISIVASVIGNIIEAVLPVIINLINQLLPIIQQIAEVLLPFLAEVITTVANAIMPIVSYLLPLLSELFQALMPVINVLASALTTVLTGAFASVSQILDGVKQVLSGLIDFIAGVFTGNWSRAWEGVKNIFGGAFNALTGIAKAPLNAVIALINKAIGGLNKIKIPDWVPGVGGKGINIPQIPMLWKGSPSSPGTFIAGEQGPELVTGAKGSKVYTANTTKGIFSKIKDSFVAGKEMLSNFNNNSTSAMSTLAFAGAGGGNVKSVVIQSSPNFYITKGDPHEIEAKLRENNERLKREIKEEMQDEEEDKKRRGY
ncbi:MAG: phage tail tape measure protein [Peptostreptococcaceae bacterium]|nr:phage tail tape measure protein [Peptostreptococcaceae bacterium]